MQTFATESPPVSLLESSLGELRAQIDLTLSSIRDNQPEARLIVTRGLGIDPQPNELDAIVRIALDPLSRDSLLESACTALALRVLAERSVRDLLEPNHPGVESVARSATVMSGLLEARDTWEHEVYRESESCDNAERDFLLQVADALLPEAEPLITGTVLAPRLLSIVGGAAGSDPRGAVKSLTGEDVELIDGAFGRGDSTNEGAGIAAVTAIALRTVIEDDVGLWESLDAAEPNEQGNGTARGDLLQRLRKERTAYRYVTRLLQTRRATVVDVGLEAFAARLVEVQARLFAAYLKLIPILNANGNGSTAAESGGENAAADKLDRLLRESAQLDAQADAAWSKRVSTEEVCIDALKRLKEPARPVTMRKVKAHGLRNPRVRMRVMLTVASVLLVTCVGLYGSRMSSGGFDLGVPVTELPVRLEPINAMAVGSMLYVTVGSWAWNELDRSQRIEGVGEIGASAGERGFSAVYLADDENNQVAVWTRDDGVQLAGDAP